MHSSHLSQSARSTVAKHIPIVEASSYAPSLNQIAFRVTKLEEILQIRAVHSDLLLRLKAVEDKIVFIEEKFPQIAMQYFEYDVGSKQMKARRASSLAEVSTTVSSSDEGVALKKTSEYFLSLLAKLNGSGGKQ